MTGSTEREASGTDLLIGLLMMPFTIALRGWVLSICWGWYLVPLGVMDIGAAHAIGISLTAAVFVNSHNNKQRENRLGPIAHGVTGALISLLILFFAWVVHAVMV